MIVKELWPAIPEGRFILIPFENELLSAPEPVTLSKVLCYSAHQKVRLLPCNLKNPSEHGRCGRLSVCAADHDGMSPRQKHFFENFRHRAVRNLAIEYFFQFRISARNDISHHNEIWRRLHMR